jgi:hypothetical protein
LEFPEIMTQIILIFTANVETRKNVCNSDVGDVFGEEEGEPLGWQPM